jgi:NhaA family Na+:H+ antiporter
MPLRTVLATFMASEAAGGIVLMIAAVLGIAVANSPLYATYVGVLETKVAGLSVLHWINDGLMAVFFLLVGVEIKKEMIEGQLSTWRKRALPLFAAIAGVVLPAAIYIFLNRDQPEALRGWAIPAATDIAFALGVLSLLGSRVPASLKIFLTALAIIDDLAAVIIIAVFYTADLRLPYLGGALAVFGLLVLLNRLHVARLAPYVLLGCVLWFLVLMSGVHATLAGVALAMAIPLNVPRRDPDTTPASSPLRRLEHALAWSVAFAVVPIFGFANAGVNFSGMGLGILTEPVSLGVAAGLFFGKQIAIFATVWALVRWGVAEMPAGATWSQVYGVAVLCGIGFTMSIFIGLLAFSDPVLVMETKIGVFAGSLTSGVMGWLILHVVSPRTGEPHRS